MMDSRDPHGQPGRPGPAGQPAGPSFGRPGRMPPPGDNVVPLPGVPPRQYAAAAASGAARGVVHAAPTDPERYMPPAPVGLNRVVWWGVYAVTVVGTVAGGAWLYRRMRWPT